VNWSQYQEDIFSYVEDPTKGNLVVEAVAGSGKSVTLKEAVRRIPADKAVLVLAFNRHIRDPLEVDLADCYNVKVQTLKGFGFGAVRRALGRPRVKGDKTGNIYQYNVLNGADSDEDRAVFYSSVSAVKKITALRKHLMIFEPLNTELLAELCDAYDVDIPNSMSESQFIYLLEQVWQIGLEDDTTIDFDDQLLYPIHHNYDLETYDFILVDEAQDLSPIQIELTKRALRPGGRAIYCGDRKQAIYQFRGADSAAIQRIERELDCDLLPLSICYRCCKSVVERAKELVPQIEAFEDAPEGTVNDIFSDEFEPKSGDFVICRTTAPLIEGCLKQLRLGNKATVKGRDIGASLEAFIKKIKGTGLGTDIDEFVHAMHEYYDLELDRLSGKRRTHAIQLLMDKYQAILAIQQHSDATHVGGLIDTIRKIFSDNIAGVTFMTVHKAKGLEAPTVYIIRPDLMPHPKSSDLDAEMNIKYVAMTRAQLELVWVDPENRPIEEEEEEDVALEERP